MEYKSTPTAIWVKATEGEREVDLETHTHTHTKIAMEICVARFYLLLGNTIGRKVDFGLRALSSFKHMPERAFFVSRDPAW